MSNPSDPTMIVLYIAEKDPDNSGFFRTAYKNVQVTIPIDGISGDRKAVKFHVPDGLNEIDRDRVVGFINPFTNEPTTNYQLRKDNYSLEALQKNWTSYIVRFNDSVTTPELEDFEDMLEDVEDDTDELTATEAVQEKIKAGIMALLVSGSKRETIIITDSNITYLETGNIEDRIARMEKEVDKPFSVVIEMPRDEETMFIVYLDGVWTSYPDTVPTDNIGIVAVREYELTSINAMINLL